MNHRIATLDSDEAFEVDFQLVAFWFAIIAAYAGSIMVLKNVAVYLFIVVNLVFLVTGRVRYIGFALILWIYLHRFFYGLGYLSLNTVSLYSKLTYIMLIGYFIFDRSFFADLVADRFFKRISLVTGLFVILIAFSFLVNHFKILRLIDYFDYYILFLFFYVIKTEKGYLENLLYLFFLICIIEIPVAILQSRFIIPAASISDVSGQSTWSALLDDAASGTFGPTASASLSWFLSFVFLCLFSIGLYKKSYKLLTISFFFLIQYAVVDSKTTLITTLVLIGAYFFLITRRRAEPKVDMRFVMTAVIFMIVFATVFFSFWELYYKNLSNVKGFRGRKIDNVGLSYSTAWNTVAKSIDNYGKIKGYRYVKELLKKEDPIKIFVGCGINEYNFDKKGRGSKVQARLKPVIRLNNGLNTRSAWNTYFAETGLIGLIFVLWLHYELLQFYFRRTFHFPLAAPLKPVIAAFIVVSVFYGFIYLEHTHNSFVMKAIWIITAFFIKIDQETRPDQLTANE
jgi:hypothetical protein